MSMVGRVAVLPAVLAVASLACGCAGAGAPVQPAPAGDTFVGADGQAMRCVNEAVTGSRVPQRVCRTEAEWRRMEEAGREYTRDAQGALTAPPEG